MREHDGNALELIGFEVVKDGVRLVAGVDDDALKRRFVRDDVAVFLKLAYRYGFYKAWLKAPLCLL